jgi:hypothetical protein
MPLLAPVIKAARARADQFQRAFEPHKIASLRSILAVRWRPLPATRRPGAAGSPRAVHAAVDGTSHAVQLSNGAHFILAVAAALGPEPIGQRDRADLEILPARYDDAQAHSARDLLMRSLEALAASQAVSLLAEEGLAERAIVWTDGSLFADLSHMAGAPARVSWGGGVERAGNLLTTTAALLGRAESAGLWLVGVAKTQRAGFLYDALAAGGPPPLPEGDRPSDGELLAAMPVGWTWPLVLDQRHIQAPSRLAAEVLAACPAIVSSYVRPHPADLPLRVDVPASAIGLDDRLFAGGAEQEGTVPRPWPAWIPDPDAFQPVIEAVL